MAKYIDDIMAKVRELSEVPPQRVVEEVALPDFDEGQKMPYIAVVFGTPGHISQATSIVSQLNDGYRVLFLGYRHQRPEELSEVIRVRADVPGVHVFVEAHMHHPIKYGF